MCKIAGLFIKNETGTSKLNKEMLATIEEMLQGNNDAMGVVDYSFASKKAKIKKYHPETIPLPKGIERLVSNSLTEHVLNREHLLDASTTFRMIHTRFATSAKTPDNTHPFSRNGIHLIHNGVIQNHHSFKKYLSTCDSEAILTQYLDLDIENNPEKITELASSLSGHFGCLVLNSRLGYVDFFVRGATVNLINEKDFFAIVTSDRSLFSFKGKKIQDKQFMRISLKDFSMLFHVDNLPEGPTTSYYSGYNPTKNNEKYRSEWEEPESFIPYSNPVTTIKEEKRTYSSSIEDFISKMSKKESLTQVQEDAIDLYWDMNLIEQEELNKFPVSEAWKYLIDAAKQTIQGA
jgi:hypothetical protein